jgi:hypothetical protein
MRKRKPKPPGPLVLTITIPPAGIREQFRDLCVVVAAINGALQATAEKLHGSSSDAFESACAAVGIAPRKRGRR